MTTGDDRTEQEGHSTCAPMHVERVGVHNIRGVLSLLQTMYKQAAATFWVFLPWIKLCCTANINNLCAASTWKLLSLREDAICCSLRRPTTYKIPKHKLIECGKCVQCAQVRMHVWLRVACASTIFDCLLSGLSWKSWNSSSEWSSAASWGHKLSNNRWRTIRIFVEADFINDSSLLNHSSALSTEAGSRGAIASDLLASTIRTLRWHLLKLNKG